MIINRYNRMDLCLKIDVNKIVDKNNLQQIKKLPMTSHTLKSSKKNDSIITKSIIKIYDVVEYNNKTYHCYKNKIYNNDKKLCGLINNKKIIIFDKDTCEINNINNKYLSLSLKKKLS
jgi:hypothetical protein